MVPYSCEILFFVLLSRLFHHMQALPVLQMKLPLLRNSSFFKGLTDEEIYINIINQFDNMMFCGIIFML